MKKNNIKTGLLTALLLASPLISAGTDYPASDFQPKVVYQDNDYQHQSSQSSSANAASTSLGEKAAADENYPAATFQPEVLYHDKDYKHHSGAVATNNSIPLAMWTEKVEEAIEEKYADKANEEESSLNFLFIVAILVCAVFLFRNKASVSVAKTSASTSVSTGQTGVQKYLEKKAPKLSGVAKYIEKHQPAPKSGVAKYVAKKIVASKKAAAEKTTGVEKYLRKHSRG